MFEVDSRQFASRFETRWKHNLGDAVVTRIVRPATGTTHDIDTLVHAPSLPVLILRPEVDP